MDLEININEKEYELESLIRTLTEKEKKLEESKYKNEFYANLSHELKTPLNILMGAMQLIELYTLNGTIIDPSKKLDKYMKNMKQNALRLLKIINNIIDLTKIDANDVSMDIHNYDIVKIVRNVVQSVEIYAKVKLVNVFFNSEINKKIIACDADKVERILLNLLSNALKFTNKNGTINISLENRDKKIFIAIKDDGIGIHKSKLNTIFQRFRQVDKSFTRNREGSGIGLSIVKALVELHNGNISVESDYGKGSKFVVTLPEVMLKEETEMKLYNQFEDEINERARIEFSDLNEIC